MHEKCSTAGFSARPLEPELIRPALLCWRFALYELINDWYWHRDNTAEKATVDYVPQIILITAGLA